MNVRIDEPPHNVRVHTVDFVLEVAVEGLLQIRCGLRGAIKGFPWDIASRHI